METPNYIYLLQEREFIKTKENIYKIGKTTRPNHERFKEYPKGSSLLLQSICTDCNCIEKELIHEFKIKFKQRVDIGTEYFEGNYIDMIRLINAVIDKHNITLSSLQLNEENDKLKHRIRFLENRIRILEKEVQSQTISKYKHTEIKKENDKLLESNINLKYEIHDLKKEIENNIIMKHEYLQKNEKQSAIINNLKTKLNDMLSFVNTN